MQITALSGLVEAKKANALAQSKPANFDEWILRVMGEGIANLFMRPYNFKVWAVPTTAMQAEWLGERVATVDVDRAINNVLRDKEDAGWGPNAVFRCAFHPLTAQNSLFCLLCDNGLHDHSLSALSPWLCSCLFLLLCVPSRRSAIQARAHTAQAACRSPFPGKTIPVARAWLKKEHSCTGSPRKEAPAASGRVSASCCQRASYGSTAA